MSDSEKGALARAQMIDSAPTGVQGLDFVLDGGVPMGRPTLLRGGPGTGKTAIALNFFCYGLAQDEPSVLVTFDESPQALIGHAEALGLPLTEYIEAGKAKVLDMRPDPGDVVGGEDIELSAIMARLGYALDQLGAKRLVVDAIDAMDSAYAQTVTLRSELARVFDWIRDRDVTTLITVGEAPAFSNQFGLEDYVADCVILLRQEMMQRQMTRLLRVLKRRGGSHGTNEFPFLLDAKGVFLAPVTGLDLQATVSPGRHSTGVARLDEMLGGGGPYKGSAMMISGQSGTGKTSIAVQFVRSACAAGEPVLYLSFEESADELLRNQQSAGLDLSPYLTSGGNGLLTLSPILPSEIGWEEHLLRIMRSVDQLEPQVVVLDPISALADQRRNGQGKEMLMRLFYMLKRSGVTVVATELLGDANGGVSNLEVSSIIDVWIKLRRDEHGGRLRRMLTVVKARGLPTSDQVSEYRITNSGVVVDAAGSVGGER
ncbi:circadian clock protein KaiC [Halorhodospira halochloris]|uniref:circadian clock protein KaiC n=1 Tax=Halorhodospira halochloris TaxID=1052 RepID=UPI001EE7DC40|nr:circadian clock protein KaiC [Halorhodospira halochloris]MCG5529720.1 circadian clock protein KaiC [Halorhodospira halochloris]